MLDVNEQAAQRVTDDLRAAGTTAIALGADVSDRAGVEHAFAKARSALEAMLVLVTCAGMFGFAPFDQITPESWSKIIDVNLTGIFTLLLGRAARYGRRKMGPDRDDLVVQCATRIPVRGPLRGVQRA